MKTVSVHPIDSAAPELATALESAGLPTDDLTEGGRSFFALEESGRPVGFGGFELYGDDVLLRSVVVLPELRGRGYGRAVTEAVLAQARSAGARQAYLLTTTAESFFEHEGFARIERTAAPASILGTTQATTICATAALFTRPLGAHG
jgi:N-acetylglutamate synthase-like GNAT family acetyltransferase